MGILMESKNNQKFYLDASAVISVGSAILAFGGMQHPQTIFAIFSSKNIVQLPLYLPWGLIAGSVFMFRGNFTFHNVAYHYNTELHSSHDLLTYTKVSLPDRDHYRYKAAYYVLDDELILAGRSELAIYVLNTTWTKISNIPKNSICSERLSCGLVVTKSNDLKA